MSAKVAVVDDEKRMLEVIAMVLGDAYEVHTFGDGQAALEALAEERFEILVSDLKMPGLSGLEVLRRARAADPELQVILITAHASISTAVEAMREGAFDYLEKPFDNDELRALVGRAAELSHLKRENRYLRSELTSRPERPRHHPGTVVAESDGMRRVLALVRKVARSRATVLITGESGTGKEIVARSLHYHSDRVDAAFVAVNAKAIAESLVDSELFGHERGAFTGAHRARRGLFERAHGGTLFLDEIGEISADFQAKLLRVLEEREVRRVGAGDSVTVDVRMVAATNRDLKAEVAEGRFREDLYFRLNVVPIHLPALRERRDDVLPLAEHFLARLHTDAGAGTLPGGFTSEAAARLERHDWPGNVRELENAVERGALLAGGPLIDGDDLLLDTAGSSTTTSTTGQTLKDVLDDAARAHVRETLARVGGARAEAAALLGVERTTLYRLMRRLELDE